MNERHSKQDLSFGGEAYRRIVAKPGGLLYTTYVNRNLAWVCTGMLKQFSPNQISIGAFCILFIALPLAYSSTDTTTSLIAYGLLVLNYVLDSTDGQVSRLRQLGSPLGEWVDHTLDGVRILLIHSTILLVLIRADVGAVFLFAGFSHLVFSASMFFGTELAGKILPKQVQGEDRTVWTVRRVVRSLVLLPADHGVFIVIFTVIHKPALLAPVYAAYGLYWGLVFLSYFVWTFLANRKNG